MHLKQPNLFQADAFGEENPDYYQKQIITYLGNKRRLLPYIAQAVETVQRNLGKPKLRMFDGFSGSGVVSRLFKSYSSHLAVNDLEAYAHTISNCFLTNPSSVDFSKLDEIVNKINSIVEQDDNMSKGFIEELYAPLNDDEIKQGERVFYTKENARKLDKYRQVIGINNPEIFDLLMGPLLASASIHANTSGVFKGFYKDTKTGIGKFGGAAADALKRIKGQIVLETPILSSFETDVDVYQQDINELISEIGDFDLAYFDPPYNQHPYGSNYFMLNLLANYKKPQEISNVSGIPTDWNRSLYNKKNFAFEQLSNILIGVDARYVLLSFNDEGFIKPEELRPFLNEIGHVNEIQIRYNTFRGSRNLSSRKIHVTEHLFLVKKKD